jgi:hypothetical protein
MVIRYERQEQVTTGDGWLWADLFQDDQGKPGMLIFSPNGQNDQLLIHFSLFPLYRNRQDVLPIFYCGVRNICTFGEGNEAYDKQ